MGINNIKKCTFYFLFGLQLNLHSWLYWELRRLSTARAKYFGGVLPFSNREVSQERPAPRYFL